MKLRFSFEVKTSSKFSYEFYFREHRYVAYVLNQEKAKLKDVHGDVRVFDRFQKL